MRIYFPKQKTDLISENLFESEATDRSYLFQSLDVEFLLITEDDVAIRLVSHVLLLEIHDVLQTEGRQEVIYLLVEVIVKSKSLCVDIGIEYRELGGALTGNLLHCCIHEIFAKAQQAEASRRTHVKFIKSKISYWTTINIKQVLGIICTYL